MRGPVSVLLGIGNGDFEQPIDFETSSDPFDFVTKDLNDDGLQDLILVNSNNPNVSVMLNSSSQTGR